MRYIIHYMNNVSRAMQWFSLYFISIWLHAFWFQRTKIPKYIKNLIKNIFYFNDPPSGRRESFMYIAAYANNSTYFDSKKTTDKHIKMYIKKGSAIFMSLKREWNAPHRFRLAVNNQTCNCTREIVSWSIEWSYMTISVYWLINELDFLWQTQLKIDFRNYIYLCT